MPSAKRALSLLAVVATAISLSAEAPLLAAPQATQVSAPGAQAQKITAAAQTLPDQYRSMPTNVLYPLLVDQAVDRLSVVAMAHKQGLDKDPEVAHAMQRANRSASTAWPTRGGPPG